jgi:hypothetical protein
MLADESLLEKNGRELARTLVAMSAYGQTGYGMAAVIAARLGEDRLREVSRSVPAFLAAYQESAVLNPVPAPVPGARGVELWQTVPPLDPEVYSALYTLLVEAFPQ